MALDTTARLIAEAQAKLTELDTRVASYRHEMATEFTRYSEELLRDVPEDVAYQVSQAIAGSILASYPSLFPPAIISPSSLSDSTSLAEVSYNGSRSPPPILPHTSGTPRAQPSSPHERELEFQGLFTPTYLPLLESVDRPLHSPTSPVQAPAIPTDTKPTSERANTSEGTQTFEGAHRRRRPSPLRHATDSSIASAASDTSSARFRKSALRRTSSASRSADSPRDPRRVRFEFQGQEVLPSSSPEAPTPALAEWGSVSSGQSSTPADDSLAVRSLADTECEGFPRPKKVSSSQALRALSKVPLDEQTTWTVVNPDAMPESTAPADAGEADTRTRIHLPSEVIVEHHEMSSMQIPERPKEEAARPSDQGLAKEDTGSGKPMTLADDSDAEDESSDEEGPLLMMSKKTSSKGQRATPARNQEPPTSTSGNFTSTQSTVPEATSTVPEVSDPASTTTPAAAPPSPSVKEKPAATGDDEEPELFSLDADDDDLSLKKAISSKGTPKKHLPEVPDEPEPEQKQKANEREAMSNLNNSVPASPPMSIPVRPPSDIPPKVLPMPQGSVPKVSIGSYGGRSLVMSPVKNPELLEKIKQSDDAPPFFVGSVHGRSGPDASNVKSYVASLPSPKGMPESFFERYIRERDVGTKYASDKDDSEGKA